MVELDMPIEYSPVFDIELEEHQKDLDKEFKRWKDDPRLDKARDSGLEDGGQGELYGYLKKWKKEWMRKFKMKLLLEGVEVPETYDQNRVTKLEGGMVQIEIDDLDASNLMRGQKEGFLISFNDDGLLGVSKIDPDTKRRDWDFSWKISVNNVVAMQWERGTEEEINLNTTEGKISIETEDQLVRLMELAAESEKEIKVTWEGDEDTVWIIKKVGFGGYDVDLHLFCDKYENADHVMQLSELKKDKVTYELVEPQKVYNKRS